MAAFWEGEESGSGLEVRDVHPTPTDDHPESCGSNPVVGLRIRRASSSCLLLKTSMIWIVQSTA